MLELIGTIVGLVYLWLEYKASIYLWVSGVIMPAIYIVVYYEAGLYADCSINVYYLLAALYGWMAWKNSPKTEDQPAGIRRLYCPPYPFAWRRIGILVVVTVLLFLLIAWALMRFTDSTVPLLDAFTTALSIVAMWMLAKKFVEQWWVWIVVDVVSAGLYVYKELHFTAVLYLLYAIIAYFGYRKWVRLMQQNGSGDVI